MAVLHPELFVSKHVCVDVETKGDLTRGATVADWKNAWGRRPNTHVLMSVDGAKFQDLYVQYIGRYGPDGRLGKHVQALKDAATAES